MKLNTIANVVIGGYATYLAYSAANFFYTFKPVSDRLKCQVSEISKKLNYHPRNLYITQTSTGSFSVGLFGVNILALDPNDAEAFTIAHELTHLKECHSLITIGASLGVILGLQKRFAPSPLIILPAVKLCLLGIGHICESRADSGAISVCSSLDLANGYSMFRTHYNDFQQNINKANFFGKLYSKLASKFDPHPDSFSRMTRIKDEIECKRLSNLDYIPLAINQFDSVYSNNPDTKISENKCSEEAHRLRQILCSGKKNDLFYNVTQIDIYPDRIDIWKDGYPIPYPNGFIFQDIPTQNSIENICTFLANSEPVVIVICKGDILSDENTKNEIQKNYNILSSRKRENTEIWLPEIENPLILVLQKNPNNML